LFIVFFFLTGAKIEEKEGLSEGVAEESGKSSLKIQEYFSERYAPQTLPNLSNPFKPSNTNNRSFFPENHPVRRSRRVESPGI
jgi:hypothetical protein